MEVTTTDQLFFTGNGDPSSIPIQLRLILDLQSLVAESYDTSLEYTLWDKYSSRIFSAFTPAAAALKPAGFRPA